MLLCCAVTVCWRQPCPVRPSTNNTPWHLTHLWLAVFSAAAVYDVTIFNAETWFDGPDQRVFDISAEGTVVVQNLDLYKAAGGKYKAVNSTFSALVSHHLSSA
jgi:hypothetical protein